MERDKEILERQLEDDVKEIKREKRRLDDLLTFREKEIHNFQVEIGGLKKTLQEKEL